MQDLQISRTAIIFQSVYTTKIYLNERQSLPVDIHRECTVQRQKVQQEKKHFPHSMVSVAHFRLKLLQISQKSD